MKKLILALLCLILALGLCACGDDPAPESNSKPENEQTTAPTETTEATEATEPLPEISLNEYVICEDQGFENYGSLSVYPDYARLIDDHSDKLKTNLDASYFGDKTPKEAATYMEECVEAVRINYFEGRRQSMDHLIADEVMQEYAAYQIRMSLRGPKVRGNPLRLRTMRNHHQSARKIQEIATP